MNSSNPTPLITILGPTASGKTRLAVAVAQQLNGEILSADSRQVYRGMDIGTGKDLEEYGQTPYHLIDICEAGERYNIYQFQLDFWAAYEQIHTRGHQAIMCGGSGLYLDAVLKGYNLTAIPINPTRRAELLPLSTDTLRDIFLQKNSPFAAKTDLASHKRLIRAIEIAEYAANHTVDFQNFQPINSLIFGIDLPRDLRRERIATRLHKRLDAGLIEEVETLLTQGVSPETLVYYGLEYKFVIEYLQQKQSKAYLTEHLTIAIQQFAKRQMTYFRKMERDGLHIHWIDGQLPLAEQLEQITRQT
ncbi:tRNA dimethylallyltransferase [Flexibacter flexilis DSM 6793]|uniref:tRNA dimethylallyltransferase n=1 Tax=Flexibacter flexilis DSM 6793 TaxID=927664 RepID=A0A1I1MTS5_9BACT|nr:tRNA (adenosine(37)-N6)-dimethylallyltransferase MiaA [Flexibacter flexilis]SFC88546.1 tRNA dimethylallyltransferase [Flexibacter flexilis DSM 6793]